MQITYRAKNGGELIFNDIVHLKSGDCYDPEESSVTRRKCILIGLFIPLFGALFLVAQTTMAILSLRAVWIQKRFTPFIKAVWNIVRTPFFCMAILAAVLSGLVSPLAARRRVGQLEVKWHQTTRAYDCCYTDESCARYVASAFRTGQAEGAFFIAVCMQPRCNLKSPSVIHHALQASRAV
jgi:hypothetical protein